MDDTLLYDADPAYIEHLFSTERYIWLSLSYDMSAVMDLEGCIEEVNTRWEDITGHSVEELIGSYLMEYIHFADREKTLARLQSLVTSDIGSTQFHFRFRCKGGLLRDLNWAIIFSPEHERYFCVIKDVTERAAEDAMAMAYRDPLTGLHNRLFLQDNFPRILDNAKEQGEQIAVLFLDLDGFKEVNDTLGHKAGDVLLQKVAKRMKEVVGCRDCILTRLGGDEFVIVGVHTRDEAARGAELIVKSVCKPFSVGGIDISIGTSMGVSLYPDHGQTPDELLERADQAMYAVKKTGKNNWTFADRTEAED